MRAVRQKTIDRMEDLIESCCDQIEALFAYTGADDRKWRRLHANAKVGGVHITGFGRVLASENNRALIERMPMPERPKGLQSA